MHSISLPVASKSLASDSQAHGRGTAIHRKYPYSVSTVSPCCPPRHSFGLLRCSRNGDAQFRLDTEWITAENVWQNAQRRIKERKRPVASPPKHTAEHPEVRLPISNGVVSGPPLEVESEAMKPVPLRKTQITRRCSVPTPDGRDAMCLIFPRRYGSPHPELLV